ncbi:chaperonin 10-like protein [Dactylonectria estremocensis]|uniref:Chaperonin 10-like protein n=1 Tax=Dactylonectria estremocensis TaxID=1079267 RepID=A0A9P9J049_9HYPO|nr:chaperonin 10-like protein [Dactylonectria estremocensis]
MSTPMRKAVITGYGDASNIEVVTAEIPAPARNEVQVDVIVAGFSGADINMRLGRYPSQKPAPLTPGYSFVGRVRKNGTGSATYKKGDLVAALTVYDSDAEIINVPEKYLVPVPEGVSHDEVVGLVLDWSTAYGMVVRTAKVSKGQRVFIHGLSGAVGYATMILSQRAGATVYGTASERNHAALKELGATPYVYTNKNWMAEIKKIGGVHAAFDALGLESYDESYSVLSSKESSILVGYGANLDALAGSKPRSAIASVLKLYARNLSIWSKKSAAFYLISRDDKTFLPDLRTLINLLKDGQINVPIKQSWDLENVRAAHENWGAAPGMGCLVIRVRKDEV